MEEEVSIFKRKKDEQPYSERMLEERDERHARLEWLASTEDERDASGDGENKPGPERVETAMRGVTMLRMLQWQKRYQARDFSQALGVSERSAREYIKQLRRAGFNIRCEPGVNGFYWLAPGENPPPIAFTNEQAEMIVAGLLVFAGAADQDDPRIREARALAIAMANALPYDRGTRAFQEGERLNKQVFRWWLTAKGFGKGPGKFGE